MHRQEIEIAEGRTSSVGWPGVVPGAHAGRRREVEGEAVRCLQTSRAYEASRLLLASLGRRRQPLD